jgi:hypothetical protein
MSTDLLDLRVVLEEAMEKAGADVTDSGAFIDGKSGEITSTDFDFAMGGRRYNVTVTPLEDEVSA